MGVKGKLIYSYFVSKGGMMAWRCCILRLPKSSLRVVQMVVRMLSMYIFYSSLSDIHLRNSMISCLGFVFISWASLFSLFSRDREALSRLLLEEGNMESNSSVGEGLGVVMKGVILMYSQEVGDSGAHSEGGVGCAWR